MEEAPLLDWRPASAVYLATIGAGVRVQIAGRRHRPDRVERQGPAGAGRMRARCCFSAAKLELRLAARWGDERLELSGALRNLSGSPIRIEQLWLGESVIELGGPAAGYRIYYNSGCQESSGTRAFSRIARAGRSVPASADPDDPDAGGGGGAARQPLFASTCIQPDHIRSQYLTVVHCQDRAAAVCIGCASFERAETAFFIKPGPSGSSVIISPVIFYNGLQLGPDEELATEQIAAFAEVSPLLALERYAEHVRSKKMLVVKPLDSIAGLWNCWVAFTEEQNTAGAEERAMEYQHTRLLDYGIRSCPPGVVWHRDNAFFESRCKPQLGPSIAEASARLKARFPELELCGGLFWGAASEGSDFFQQHPEGLLRDGRGKLCPRGPKSEPSWGRCPSPGYWVDCSHPATQQFFSAHLLALKEKADIGAFNFDFMGDHGEWRGAWGYLREDDNPFLNCRMHDPGMNRPFETDRVLPGIVRRILGPSVVIRTYTAMFMRLLGLVDVVRTAADALRVEYGGRLLPVNWDHLRGILQNLAANYAFHGRWWWSDSCAICVGTQPVPQRLEEFRIRSLISFLAGGPITLGDDVPRMMPEQFRYYTINLPPTGHAGRPLDLFDRELPQVYHLDRQRSGFGHDLITLINLTDRVCDHALKLSVLGMSGPLVAFEFWTKEASPLQDGILRVALPPLTARHFAVHRDEGIPLLLGTDFHLSMGGMEIGRCQWDPANRTLSGSIRRPAPEDGHLYVWSPERFRPAGLRAVGVRASSAPARWQVSFA